MGEMQLGAIFLSDIYVTNFVTLVTCNLSLVTQVDAFDWRLNEKGVKF